MCVSQGSEPKTGGRRSERARMRGGRTSLKDPGLWYAVRSRISVMGFLCVGESG